MHSSTSSKPTMLRLGRSIKSPNSPGKISMKSSSKGPTRVSSAVDRQEDHLIELKVRVVEIQKENDKLLHENRALSDQLRIEQETSMGLQERLADQSDTIEKLQGLVKSQIKELEELRETVGTPTIKDAAKEVGDEATESPTILTIQVHQQAARIEELEQKLGIVKKKKRKLRDG